MEFVAIIAALLVVISPITMTYNTFAKKDEEINFGWVTAFATISGIALLILCYYGYDVPSIVLAVYFIIFVLNLIIRLCILATHNYYYAHYKDVAAEYLRKNGVKHPSTFERYLNSYLKERGQLYKIVLHDGKQDSYKDLIFKDYNNVVTTQIKKDVNAIVISFWNKNIIICISSVLLSPEMELFLQKYYAYFHPNHQFDSQSLKFYVEDSLSYFVKIGKFQQLSGGDDAYKCPYIPLGNTKKMGNVIESETIVID